MSNYLPSAFFEVGSFCVGSVVALCTRPYNRKPLLTHFLLRLSGVKVLEGVRMASSEKTIPKNRLLAALPQSEYRRLLPKLETVSLSLKQRIYESGGTIDYVYFPLNGITSLVAFMQDGSAIEVAAIGNEGMVGLPLFLGADKTPLVVFQQIPGESMRMESKVFTKEIKRNDALTAVLHLYTQVIMMQIAQGNACNRAHSIEQRCARWLLMTHDRMRRQQRFSITQEFLGQMLGVRRAGVSEACSALKKNKLIDYQRGIMNILDRKGLEKRTCECYWVIRNEIDRLSAKR
jgi:CRP-like cAMP-binding protein